MANKIIKRLSEDGARATILTFWIAILLFFSNSIKKDTFISGFWIQNQIENSTNLNLNFLGESPREQNLFDILSVNSKSQIHFAKIDSLNQHIKNVDIKIHGGISELPRWSIWIFKNFDTILIGTLLFFIALTLFSYSAKKFNPHTNLGMLILICLLHGFLVLVFGGIYSSPIGICSITIFFMLLSNDIVKIKMGKNKIISSLPSVLYLLAIMVGHIISEYYCNTSMLYKIAVREYFTEVSCIGFLNWYNVLIFLSLFFGGINSVLRSDDVDSTPNLTRTLSNILLKYNSELNDEQKLYVASIISQKSISDDDEYNSFVNQLPTDEIKSDISESLKSFLQ